MSGVKETKYKPKYLTQGRKNSRNSSELGSEIVSYFMSIGEDVKEVSKAWLRKHFAPDLKSNDREWRNAMLKVKGEQTGWHGTKKMMVRNA